MSFRTTVKNQRLSHFVAASALGLADKVNGILAGKLGSLLREGEILPDLALLQQLIGRFLEERGIHLLGADDRYSNDQVIARDLRLEREALVGQLRLRLRDARHFFDRQLGKERSEAYLPNRNFSRLGAAELIRLANQAAALIRDSQGALARVTGIGVGGPAELMTQLETEAAQLQEVLDRQEGQHARQKQQGLEEKTAEIAAAEKAIRNAANLLTGLYSFADLPFHAQRVRRRVNRKSNMPEEEAKLEAEIGNATGGGSAGGLAAEAEEETITLA
jgi:hypothetical protein